MSITFKINILDKVSNKNEVSNDYDDYMTKCAKEGCSYYFYYMGRSDYCELCR